MGKIKIYETLGKLHADTINYCKENKIGCFRTYGDCDYLLFKNSEGITLKQALKNLEEAIEKYIKNNNLLKRTVELSKLVNNLNIEENKLGLYQCSNTTKKKEWKDLERKYITVYFKSLNV